MEDIFTCVEDGLGGSYAQKPRKGGGKIGGTNSNKCHSNSWRRKYLCNWLKHSPNSISICIV